MPAPRVEPEPGFEPSLPPRARRVPALAAAVVAVLVLGAAVLGYRTVTGDVADPSSGQALDGTPARDATPSAGPVPASPRPVVDEAVVVPRTSPDAPAAPTPPADGADRSPPRAADAPRLPPVLDDRRAERAKPAPDRTRPTDAAPRSADARAPAVKPAETVVRRASEAAPPAATTDNGAAAAEAARIADERRLADERRVADERRAADERRVAEERRQAEERRLVGEAARADEERRQATAAASQPAPAPSRARDRRPVIVPAF